MAKLLLANSGEPRYLERLFVSPEIAGFEGAARANVLMVLRRFSDDPCSGLAGILFEQREEGMRHCLDWAYQLLIANDVVLNSGPSSFRKRQNLKDSA